MKTLHDSKAKEAIRAWSQGGFDSCAELLNGLETIQPHLLRRALSSKMPPMQKLTASKLEGQGLSLCLSHWARLCNESLEAEDATRNIMSADGSLSLLASLALDNFSMDEGSKIEAIGRLIQIFPELLLSSPAKITQTSKGIGLGKAHDSPLWAICMALGHPLPDGSFEKAIERAGPKKAAAALEEASSKIRLAPLAACRFLRVCQKAAELPLSQEATLKIETGIRNRVCGKGGARARIDIEGDFLEQAKQIAAPLADAIALLAKSSGRVDSFCLGEEEPTGAPWPFGVPSFPVLNRWPPNKTGSNEAAGKSERFRACLLAVWAKECSRACVLHGIAPASFGEKHWIGKLMGSIGNSGGQSYPEALAVFGGPPTPQTIRAYWERMALDINARTPVQNASKRTL